MKEKICKTIGNFLLYCIELVEDKENKTNLYINKDTINEWLYGGKEDE